jgi:hypothetical protein
MSVAGRPRRKLVAKLLTVCAPASSFTAGGLFGIRNDGASLTALTVIVNCCGAEVFELGATLLPLSLKVTLKLAEPLVSVLAV